MLGNAQGRVQDALQNLGTGSRLGEMVAVLERGGVNGEEATIGRWGIPHYPRRQGRSARERLLLVHRAEGFYRESNAQC